MAQQKVLIIDDDEDANFTVKSVLENAGFEVLSYFDGESALKDMKNVKPDLVILDIVMPGMSGYDVCDKLKVDPATADIPIIILTAKDTGEDVELALKKKADWFVTKPYDNKYLIGKINQFIAKK